MDFDLFDKYSTYSNTELLKIIKQPGNYQTAAVEAAKEILATRDVTEADVEQAESFLSGETEAKQLKQEKIDDYKNKLSGFLQNISEPTEEVKPASWLKVFLLFVGIQYIYTLYKTIKSFVYFVSCEYCPFDFGAILQFIGLAYIPIIFILLYQRKRWGWILLFADNLFAFLGGIFQLYFFFKYQDIHHGITQNFLLPVIIKGLFSFFLWREEITHFFGISKETRKKTLLVTTLGTILFIGIVFLIT